MKVFSTIILIFSVFFMQNTAFAIVVHTSDQTPTANVVNNRTVTKQKKTNFAERIIAKAMVKISEKGKSDMSQGDKLAKMGFWGVIGSIALSTLGSLAAGTAGIPPVLSAIISLLSLAGLILCIVALTRDDLSAQGRKLAKWGIGIFLALLVIALVLILAVLAAFA